MAKLEFTPHQREAIEAQGGSLLVSAAAGSGKTAVLTERVIRLLTGERPVEADRLVVVTFTVSAAEEMRSRISGRLAERIAAEPANEQLLNQQLLLSSAKICTIHSLCSSLIQENAQSLGLPDMPRIVEEADLAVIKANALEEVFEECYSGEDEAFRMLVEFTCIRNDRPLSEMVLALYDYIRSFAFPLDYLDRALSFYEESSSMSGSVWGRSVCGHLSSALSYCVGILKNCMEEMSVDDAVSEKYGSAFSHDAEQFSYIEQLVRQGRLDEAAACAKQVERIGLSPVKNYSSRGFLDYLQGRRKKVYEVFEDIRERFLSYTGEDFADDVSKLAFHCRTLFRVTRRLYEKIEEKKREEEVLDYSDLEHLALSLLVEETPDGRQKSAVARGLSERYEEIMVDECQDINEVQNLIFTLLSRDETNLFMVGDVKQSIYRFRKAMPQLFMEKRKSYSRYHPDIHTLQSKETILLETNFRSRREVCDMVNFVFSQLMTEEVGEVRYTEEEELVPGAVYPDYAEACPEIHILDYSRDSEEDKAVAEARYIAGRIREMVDSGYQVASKTGLRHCTYRDFAILLRSHKSKAPIYAGELEAAGVPCYSESSEGYFDSYEVMVMLNLLRVIDNPLLDVPLLSVLMSPMFSFPADKITEIRLAKRNVPFYTALLLRGEQGDEACRSFAETLRGFRQKAATERVDTLIQEIYETTDFLSLACVMAGGGERDANLRLLLTYAERYEGFGANGLSGFLRYINRIIDSGGDFTVANTVSAGSDAVRILSIHKSKGLEFPICILADCGKKFNKQDLNGRFQMNASLGFSMKITDAENLKSYKSLPFEAIRLKTERESISEEMRVLYVAMTRAKEKLILVLTLPHAQAKLQSAADARASASKPPPYEVFRAQGFDGWLLCALIAHPAFEEIRRQIGRGGLPSVPASFPMRAFLAPLSSEAREASEVQRVFTAASSKELSRELAGRIHFQYPFAELTGLPAKLTVTQIAKAARAEKITLEKRPAFLQSKGLTPAQRGTILHSFMQFADFERAERDLAGEVERLVVQKFLTREEAGALNLPKITAFLHSPLYHRMKNAQKLYREYKFLYFVRAGEVEPEISPEFAQTEILIQGIADCLLFEPEGIVIVDYKTDYENDPSVLAERYYDQLRIYRDAMEQAFSLPVKQCLLYSLHLEREIEIPLEKGSLK